jgi:hypothetical protein
MSWLLRGLSWGCLLVNLILFFQLTVRLRIDRDMILIFGKLIFQRGRLSRQVIGAVETAGSGRRKTQ